MLYEFAMTPDLFDNTFHQDILAGTILKELLKGITVNGILANLNEGGWERLVAKKISLLSSHSLRDKIISLFNLLDNRKRLIQQPRLQKIDPISDIEWLNLTLKLHTRNNLYAIILSNELRNLYSDNCDEFIDFYDSLDSEKWDIFKTQTRDLSISKTPNEYKKALLPVLKYARKVKLIDPYINPYEDRFLNIVRFCAELSTNGCKIFIHSNYEIPPPNRFPHHNAEQRLNYWETKLNPLIRLYNCIFYVYFWKRKNPQSPDMHNRYILTDQCGIKVAHGLDCSPSNANIDEWNILDEDKRNKLWWEYEKSTSPYEYVDHRKFE